MLHTNPASNNFFIDTSVLSVIAGHLRGAAESDRLFLQVGVRLAGSGKQPPIWPFLPDC